MILHRFYSHNFGFMTLSLCKVCSEDEILISVATETGKNKQEREGVG